MRFADEFRSCVPPHKPWGSLAPYLSDHALFVGDPERLAGELEAFLIDAWRETGGGQARRGGV